MNADTYIIMGGDKTAYIRILYRKKFFLVATCKFIYDKLVACRPLLGKKCIITIGLVNRLTTD